MQFTYLLRLVSSRGDGLRGFGKDPHWPGWIPLQAFGPQNLPIAAISLASGGRGAAREAIQGGEYRFITKPQDLDFHTLQKWFLNGETLSAKVNVLPAAVGEEGFQLVFEGAMVSFFSPTAAAIEFSLNFDSMEWRYLMRFR